VYVKPYVSLLNVSRMTHHFDGRLIRRSGPRTFRTPVWTAIHRRSARIPTSPLPRAALVEDLLLLPVGRLLDEHVGVREYRGSIADSVCVYEIGMDVPTQSSGSSFSTCTAALTPHDFDSCRLPNRCSSEWKYGSMRE